MAARLLHQLLNACVYHTYMYLGRSRSGLLHIDPRGTMLSFSFCPHPPPSLYISLFLSPSPPTFLSLSLSAEMNGIDGLTQHSTVWHDDIALAK